MMNLTIASVNMSRMISSQFAQKCSQIALSHAASLKAFGFAGKHNLRP